MARPFDCPERAGAGYLDIYAAVHGTTLESANMGITGVPWETLIGLD